MTSLASRGYGPGNKPLDQLSDKELLDELSQRRAKRELAPGNDDKHPTPGRVRQYFANLELEPTATLAEVERAYRRLVDKYHPDKHAGDPAKHKAASELTESLNKAYEAVAAFLKRTRG